MQYKEIVPWGRSYEEYLDMFALAPDDLKKKILGIGDGPASFNAIMHQNKRQAASLDPLYQLSREQIQQSINETREIVLAETTKHQDQFTWTHIKDIKDLERRRTSAMNAFLKDYDAGRKEKRYIAGSLPSLNFPDHSFDLILSSHLLLLYSDHLSLDFHIESIQEMLRIAPEVRIFPVVDTQNNPSQHLEPVMEYFKDRDVEVALQKVDYEFQIGGNMMVRFVREASP